MLHETDFPMTPWSHGPLYDNIDLPNMSEDLVHFQQLLNRKLVYTWISISRMHGWNDISVVWQRVFITECYVEKDIPWQSSPYTYLGSKRLNLDIWPFQV